MEDAPFSNVIYNIGQKTSTGSSAYFGFDIRHAPANISDVGSDIKSVGGLENTA